VEGASVAVTYSKGADAAASVVKEIERGGGKAIAIQADAADADAGRKAVERTVTTHGRLDVLVNNAGTIIQTGPIDSNLNPASGERAARQKAAVPLDRYGHADEVAALVAFVAGPESSSINGANLTVDGGINARTRVESTMNFRPIGAKLARKNSL
jgi:NAD(P)-dependent dehydrogenase (short-subunit alcohol dehydrogenase family)